MWCWHHNQRSTLRRVENTDAVLVVEDDRFTASLLAESLARLGWDVLGPVGSVSSALRAVSECDLLPAALVDLDLGSGPDGIDLAIALRDRWPDIGLVLLTAYRTPRMFRPDRYDAPLGMRLVSKADVHNVAVLDAELRAAIAAPHAVNPGLMAPVVTPSGEHLTDRQVAMMRLIADGLSNAAIAQRLGIEEPSVEKAVARLLRRLGLNVADGGNPRVLLARAYEQMARPRRS